MSQALCFQSVEFDVIQQNQQPWVRGYQIGSALGYTAPDVQISKLYTRHADEFTPAMTAVVTLPTEGGPQETRIFSLRGCHLLAMFARTPVAKAFRKWCLDVIEQYGDRVPVECPTPLAPSTPDDRKPLRDMVNVWARLSGVHPSNLWPQVRARFQLGRIDDLPTNWLPDALAWVQGKIDELNQKPKATLPAAEPLFDEAPLLELAEDIRRAQQTYRRSYQLFWGRLYRLGTPVLVQLEQRAALGQGTAPFSDMTIRGQFDRFLSERLLESLSSLAELLPDRHNPAMLLLACARTMNAR
ncbi:BRO-N domain-containing protein [Bilophila wadsworthia]